MSLNDILSSQYPVPEPWKAISVYDLNVTHSLNTPNGPAPASLDQLLSGTLSGAITDTYVFRLSSQTIGSVTTVTAHFPADVQFAVASDLIRFSLPIPSNLKPICSSVTIFPVCLDDNNVSVFGVVKISSSGDISFGVGAACDPFSGLGRAGIPADIFITWNLSNNQ